MKISVSQALNECLSQLREGKTVNECLAKYPHLRGPLEPLLDTAALLTTTPRKSPSVKLRNASHRRLMRRISKQQKQPKQPEAAIFSHWLRKIYGGLNDTNRQLKNAFIRYRTVAVSIAIIASLIIGSGAFIYGSFAFVSRPALAASCTLTVLNGSVATQSRNSEMWADAQDGITLQVGSRVRTNADSDAVLTFFDGSTIKLDPNTDMTIEQLESNGSRTSIVLKQWLGRTWSSVTKMITPDSRFEIKTRTASALVRGTLFSTELDQIGLMAVKTTEGLVDVTTQSQEVHVAAGQQTAVQSGLSPTEPAPMPPPENQIVITIKMPAVGSVRDPSGASTGYFPSGMAFNQIPGSRSSSPAEGIQIITIPQPKPGEYVIALRGIDTGVTSFTIRGESKGQTVFEQAGKYQVTKGNGGLININLDVKDGQVTGATIGNPEPLGGKSPEQVVMTPAAAEKAATLALKYKSDEQEEASSNAGGNSDGSNAGGNSGGSNAGGNSDGSNAGGNSGGSNAGGNSGGSNAGGNSGGSNAGGNSGGSNAGGNSGGSNAGGNAGGNSDGSNAGGNSGGSNAGGNAGGNSDGSNAGGNSDGSNAGGNK